ncbi:MAG: molybdopterin molybdenumtransferase MoeA [Moraxellaceae bacterium]|nr:MAG: molybdopterin molybdenumtransferase MoeA [Moraxellaceae bacterium]
MSQPVPTDTSLSLPLKSGHECSHEGLISLDDALASYASVQRLPVISLPLLKAHRYILAQDIISPVELPLFDQSAVDGYALRQEDIDAGLRKFELIGEIRAGIEQQLTLHAGQSIRIFTGGKIPCGADTIARQEIVQREQHHIELMQPINVGTDIRYQGEELAKGTILAKQGDQLNSGLIAALSMAGVQQVNVHRQPKIAVLITGNEISSQRDHEAQVFDANGPLISSWLAEQGYPQIHIQHVNDEAEPLRQTLQHALHHFDLVLTTGGVSVGDYDLIRPVSMQLGAQQIFWQVAQKPGKPLYFASFHHSQNFNPQDPNPQNRHQSYLLGLPGNPAAVLIGLHLHVKTLLNYLQNRHNSSPHWQTGQMATDLKADSRERLLRMQRSIDINGQNHLTILPKQQSHMLSNMALASALVRIPAYQTITPESVALFIPL